MSSGNFTIQIPSSNSICKGKLLPTALPALLNPTYRATCQGEGLAFYYQFDSWALRLPYRASVVMGNTTLCIKGLLFKSKGCKASHGFLAGEERSEEACPEQPSCRPPRLEIPRDMVISLCSFSFQNGIVAGGNLI